MFRLPNKELLDGNVDCSIWAPYSKRFINGKFYISNNYICFASKVNKILIHQLDPEMLMRWFILNQRLPST